MSTCSLAKGLLSAVAILHFAITVVLGVLVAVILYYNKRKKVSPGTTTAYDASEDIDSAPEHHMYTGIDKNPTSGEYEKSDKHTDEEIDDRQSEDEVHISNPWTSSSQDDLLEAEEIKEDLGRREARSSVDQPKGPLSLKRIESPLGSDAGGPRRRSRISIASITNNLFNRKSVDLSDAAKQLMGEERDSSAAPSSEGASSTEQLDQAVSKEEKEKDATFESRMTLTIDFPSSVSGENESSC